MFTAQNADDMVECPYNKVHRMLRKRLQAHLLKCRISYPDVELRKCPFNQTHLVPEPEFVHHVTNCTDRKLITQYKYDAPAAEIEEERIKQETVECDENWDDTEVEDYNPNKHVEQAKVLRQAVGGLPTQRKEFIKQERKRLGDYNSGDEEEENKAKVKKYDWDRPHSSDEEADYVYSTNRLRTPPPPPPINVQWFEDIKGREDDDESTTRREEGKNRTSRDDGNRNRRNRRLRSREDRWEQGSSGTGSVELRQRREQHNGRNNNYALDDDPYYNQSDEFNARNRDIHIPEAHLENAQERYDRPFYDRFC